MALQEALARENPEPWRPHGARCAVAGLFVCFARSGPAGERAWAGAALTRGSRFIEAAVVSGATGVPYEPGLLALREGPLLQEALHALEGHPDVVVVNATGRDHPRRAGLALHLGAVVGMPTVGVTDRPLLATGSGPAGEKGSAAPLELEGDVVGHLLRTRRGARPVAVHAAWRTDPEVAVQVVMACARRARTPEPLRRARRVARLARAGLLPTGGRS